MKNSAINSEKSVFTYILNSSEPDFTASKEQWLQMACNHKTATLCEEFSYQLHKHVYLLNSIGGRVHRAVGSHSPSSLKELWLWSVKLQHCSKTAFHTHAFHSIYFLGLEKSPNCVPLNMLKPNLKFNRLWIHYLLLNSFWLIKK